MWKPIALIFVCSLFLLSCSDDEQPPAIIAFATPTSVVDESIGTANITLSMDRPAPGDITVTFSLQGTATAGADFTSNGTATIAAGTTQAAIAIQIIDDNVFELNLTDQTGPDETIELVLTGVTGNAQLGADATALSHTITITENDDEPFLQIDLSWQDAATGTAGDVDMDLIFWFEQVAGSGQFQFGPNELQTGTTIGTGFETIIISSLNPDFNFGLTFLYFEGSATTLNFTVTYTVVGGTLLNGQTTASFTGTYTQANLNPDAFDTGDFKIEQTFSKQGLNYPFISPIVIPTDGSRAALPKPVGYQKIEKKR